MVETAATDPVRLTRVLVADANPLVRQVTSRLLDQHDDLHIVAEADTAGAAIDEAARHRPDVAVIDSTLIEASSFDVCAYVRAKSAATRCIVHASADVGRLPDSASAKVFKQLRGEQLIRTIRAVVDE